MTRIALTILGLVFSTAILGAQEEKLVLEGGSFSWRDETITVSAEEMAHHLAIVRRLNPRADDASLAELSWARAIRIGCARAEGMTIDEDDYNDWMRARHRSLIIDMANRDLDPAGMVAAWKDYVRKSGFESVEEYEEASREEFLGELFVRRDLKGEVDEAEVRARFEEMYTAYEITALVFAPETLRESQAPAPDSEEGKALFRSWWQSLPEVEKRTFDDKQRPAAECECIYVTFLDKSQAELKEFIERKNPLGTSIAEETADLVPTPVENGKMLMRWTKERRSTMAHINGELPTGLDDIESYELVRPHLVREWKVYRYLGKLWQELRAAEETPNLRLVAKQHGLGYRHFPFQPTHRLINDEDGGGVLNGDHPLGFRRTEPGEIFDYQTHPEAPSKYYYVEGVVDQPGRHGSIFRLIRYEGLRVLSAEDAMETAWDRFVAANDYRVVLGRAEQFAAALEEQMKKELQSREDEEPAAIARREAELSSRLFSIYFQKGSQRVRDAQLVGPFFARPFQGVGGLPKKGGRLSGRVIDFVERDWTGFIGPIGTELREGQIIPMARSDDRRVALMLRIDGIHPPPESQWRSDPAGRERARESLSIDARRVQTRAAQTIYRFPRIVQEFALKAPQLEKLMGERIRRSLPKQPKKDEDSK